jgi:hypothetical protein
MNRRDSGKALIAGAAALAAAMSLSACVGLGRQNAADFPKFSDIPAKPVTAGTAAASDAEVSTLRAMADQLAQQTAEGAVTDSTWANAARTRGAAPASSTAQIDAEAYARAARARATPPPTRK